jgi:hypothetical protein
MINDQLWDIVKSVKPNSFQGTDKDGNPKKFHPSLRGIIRVIGHQVIATAEWWFHYPDDGFSYPANGPLSGLETHEGTPFAIDILREPTEVPA